MKVSEAIDEILFNLGSTLIDIEIEPDECKKALEFSKRYYLSRAENATREVMVLFKAQKDKQIYDLTEIGVLSITKVYRHSIGTSYSSDNQLDPFSMMYHNNFMAAASNNTAFGSIGIIHMQHMHINLLTQMMANEVQYTFDPSSQNITILKRIARNELLVLQSEVERSVEELLQDTNINSWLIQYATARLKVILGMSYSKFQTIAGPNGGITLGGSELRQEGKEELEKLEEQLKNFTTQTKGMPFTVG